MLPDEAFVPIGFIAIGRSGTICPPRDAPTVHEELNRIGFLRNVFGVDRTGRPRIDVMTEAMTRYSRALEAHRNDRILAGEP